MIVVGVFKLIQWINKFDKWADDLALSIIDGIKDTFNLAIGGISDLGVWLAQFIAGPVKDFGLWLNQFVVSPIKDFGAWLSEKVIGKLVSFGNWLGSFITGGHITNFGDWMKKNFITGGFITNFKAWITGLLFGEGSNSSGTSATGTAPLTNNFKDWMDVQGGIGKALGMAPSVVTPTTNNTSSNKTIIFNGVTPQDMLNTLKSELYSDTTLGGRF